MIAIKIQNGCWQRSTTQCVNEKELKPNHCKKSVLQCRTLKARKGIINAYEAKAKVQTTTRYNVMHRLGQGPKRNPKMLTRKKCYVNLQ